MDLKELILRIKGDPKGATDALGKVQAATSKFGSIVKTVIAGAAVAAVVKFGKSCIDAAGEAQQGEVMLRNSLGNVKGMTDAAKDSAVAWVNSMEKSKSFDDAEISAALQRVIVKTGDLTKSQEYVSIAMEVARNKGIDLSSATTLLEQAYNGSARGLKQFGVEVKEGATGMDYLHAIQVKVKGSGDAWLTTLEGQRTALKTTFGNLQEAIGGALMPLANELIATIMPGLTKGMELITKYTPEIKEGVNAFLTTVQKIGAWVIETVDKMWKALKPSVDAVVQTIGPYIKELFEWLKTQVPNIQKILVGVAEGIGAAFRIVASVIEAIVEAVKWVINNGKKVAEYINTPVPGRATNAGVVSPVPHASGGWVGLNGPELALVGEKGPEYITPAGQTSGNDLLLRGIADRLDTLIRVSAGIPSGIGNALNGLGR